MEESPSPVLKKKRPVALIVIAIIGAIYAGANLAGSVQSAIYAPIMQALSGFMGGLSDSFGSSPSSWYPSFLADLAPFLLLIAAIGLPVSVTGLVVCIGTLKKKPWGRTGMTVFAILLFVEAVAVGVIVFAMLNPMFENMGRLMGAGSSSAFTSSFLATYSAIMRAVLILTVPLNCVLPAVMLVILNKPAVKEYYRELRGVSA